MLLFAVNYDRACSRINIYIDPEITAHQLIEFYFRVIGRIWTLTLLCFRGYLMVLDGVSVVCYENVPFGKIAVIHFSHILM